jgi:chemotaxis protein MotB
MVQQRSKRRQEEARGAPGWVVTYGDMMSLLLTFFVLLLSFSSVSEEEFQKAMSSLRGALGVLKSDSSLIELRMAVPRPTARTPRSVERMARELRWRLQVQGKAKDISMEFDEAGGLKISLPSHVLFDSARAELRPAAFPLLGDVSDVLADVPSAVVEVRGHTDSRPLRSSAQFADNLDLSYARAKSVQSVLVERGAVAPERCEIIAKGPYAPVADNATPEGRQANRRVEIYVRGELTQEELEKLGGSIPTMQTAPS